MKIKSQLKKIAYLCLVLVMGVVCLSGCGEQEAHFNKSNPLPTSSNSTEEDKTTSNICIIQELNMLEETITVFDTVSTRVLRYKYSLATQFLDKYGAESSSMNFTPGTAVVLGDKMKSNALSSIKMSDKTWTQTGITKYTIDTTNHKMTIGGGTYRFTDNICVYSGNESISILSVGESDTLTVVGKDKNILSIAVTTGHGYIQFVNTGNFEGSMVQIGTKIFAKVKSDLITEVPEGSYDVTVANNGLGGTVKCDVRRGEISVIDLAQVEQAGNKSCKLTFVVSMPNVKIYLDGNEVNANQEMDVPYGTHMVKVTATGYSDWDRTLYVNSPSAKIAIDMSDDSSSNTTSSNTTSNTSKSNSTNSTSKSSTSSDVDYLSTLSNMISTLTGSD
ncbi:MAG: hypothetical protein K5644_07265 [Lachnospiraceae bacterium]|nr:hypothetical protein [Lachnospiraceae bacterium]